MLSFLPLVIITPKDTQSPSNAMIAHLKEITPGNILDSQNKYPQALLTHNDWRHLRVSLIILKQEERLGSPGPML